PNLSELHLDDEPPPVFAFFEHPAATTARTPKRATAANNFRFFIAPPSLGAVLVVRSILGVWPHRGPQDGPPVERREVYHTRREKTSPVGGLRRSRSVVRARGP